MPVIGTAGHVDHGKSAVVQALTGLDPDRLAEEKRRGMTIDLGFGHLALPGAVEVGIVDVPGHARFLPNMLAGVHGLDVVLLVVAADEGVMPQTREHLDIVGLVGVVRVVVALTKVDLVGDEESLALTEAEVAEELTRRGLRAPIVRVSAPAGVGLDSLREALGAALAAPVGAPVPGRDRETVGPRLPVDRVFVMKGFGPVVTGTLIDGPLRVGQDVELVPSGRGAPGPDLLQARIRGLQQHGRQVDEAAPNNRVAVNLQGVDRQQLARGHVLSRRGSLGTTDRLTMRLTVLSGATQGVPHNARVTVFSGTSSSPARVRVLEESSELVPGAEGMVEIRLGSPMALVRGDAVVLRRPSPAATLAGGAVDDLDPPRYSRRGGVWRATADPRRPDNEYLRRDVLAMVREHHARHPSRSGMPRGELRQPAGTARQDLAAAVDGLVSGGELVAVGDALAVPGWEPRLSPAQAAAVDRVLARLGETPLSPPRISDLAADGLDDAIRRYLEEQGLAVRVAPDLLMLPDALGDAEARLRAHLQAHRATTVAQARDLLGSSRKTVVPLLEYFDAVRLTRREGDVRVLRT
ncbi:MAG TPA: selenocysteine-specific translation elongation factor [Candidatus Dormibacteraeota bacterium]|nr:selenocysteine-specific translation elongation factor [Candidatus Dormibacteraeota bacterium]